MEGAANQRKRVCPNISIMKCIFAQRKKKGGATDLVLYEMSKNDSTLNELTNSHENISRREGKIGRLLI